MDTADSGPQRRCQSRSAFHDDDDVFLPIAVGGHSGDEGAEQSAFAAAPAVDRRGNTGHFCVPQAYASAVVSAPIE